MNKKYTLEEVQNIVKSKGFELISDEYVNIDAKLIVKDKEGYLYFISLYCLMRYKPCFVHPSNPFSINNIKLWLQIKNRPLILLSDIYVKNTGILKWKCLKDDCGEIFERSWDLIQRGGMCLYCVGHMVSKSNCLAIKRPDLASEWHPTLNGDLTPYDVTCGDDSKHIWWQCGINSKHIWKSYIYNRMICNCPYCHGRYASEDYNLLKDNPKLCKEWDYTKNKKNPEEYTPCSNKKIYWICSECGYKWKTSISSRNGRNTGCKKCNNSKGENRIDEILNIKNITHFPQWKFKDCKHINELPFDFYLPNYNLCIEYQGRQHYEPVDIFGGDKQYIKQVTHDKIKRDYCIENNIYFLEIPYWDLDNIEQLLMNKINIITNDNL